MKPKSKMVKCPRCGKMILDTGGETVTCKYCGALLPRSEIEEQRDEELERKLEIVRLKWEIDALKTKARVTQIFGVVFFVIGVAMLFADVFQVLQIVLTLLLLVSGVVLYMFIPRRMDKEAADKKARRRDLVMGR
ncbi:MAG: hypothetical protein J7K08_03810 [Thermoplasmata archaeon]|nr:hypothetical protein [Thermoplasmata archaeon]